MPIDSKKLIVALDTSDGELIRRMVRLLAERIGMFKVGSQAFTAFGQPLVHEILDVGGRVFLDLKFHDIPNTVASAAEEAAKLGVSLITVHAAGGRAMLKEVAGRLSRHRDGKGNPKTRAVAVTVLTSLDQEGLNEVGIQRGLEAQVLHLAGLAKECGLDGVVASPMETARLRKKLGPDFLLVVPGIRPPEAGADDQKRIATPQEAVAQGASYIVVGRPIVKAPDPVEAVEVILGG